MAKGESSNDEKLISAAEQEPGGLFAWCNTYPGSLPSLASPSIKPWDFKLASWNVNGLRAWIKVGLSNFHLYIITRLVAKNML